MNNKDDKDKSKDIISVYDMVKLEAKKEKIKEAEKRKNQKYYFVKDRVYWKDENPDWERYEN